MAAVIDKPADKRAEGRFAVYRKHEAEAMRRRKAMVRPAVRWMSLSMRDVMTYLFPKRTKPGRRRVTG